MSPVALEQPDNIETLFQPLGHSQASVVPVTATVLNSTVRSPPASPLRHARASPPPPAGALTTRDPTWQSAKCSVRERNAAMFNNSLMADIYFLVGQPSDIVKR